MTESALQHTALGREAAGLDACVHCGFCLSACPTYLTLEDENDSPRGRLVLMRALLEGDLAPDDQAAGVHLDRCLGCRACETACPSGVPYGKLLEATRETLAPSRPLPLVPRAMLFVFARPLLLRCAMTLARWFRATGLAHAAARLPPRFGFPFAMLASTARQPRPQPLHSAAPSGPTRERVAVLQGCVMEGLLAPVNRDTEFALREQGYQMVPAPGQRCCGALHVHAGDANAARGLARHNIAAFEASGAEFLAVNSAGCGSTLKEYGHLLSDDPAWHQRAAAMGARVRDVSELLAAAGPRPAPGPRVRVTYDAPCHLQHAQRITAPPLAVLGALHNTEIVPLAGSDQCCGSAGIYNLIEPAVAAAVLKPKLAAIVASGAVVVATGNPGCLMQIGAGLLQAGSGTVARHPVELLAEAYRRAAGPP